MFILHLMLVLNQGGLWTLYLDLEDRGFDNHNHKRNRKRKVKNRSKATQMKTQPLMKKIKKKQNNPNLNSANHFHGSKFYEIERASCREREKVRESEKQRY